MMARPVLTILRNDALVPAGHLEQVATALGVPVDLVALDAGDALPDPIAVDAVVVLGGEMGAYESDRVPYLEAEKRFLAEVVERDVPVLGLCLGCQLLAEALGGSAFLAERPEVTFATMTEVEPDPVVSALVDGRSLAMHRDTWELPPGGRLVARTVGYNGAFRLGSALGVQPHPEVDEPSATMWLTHPEGMAMAKSAGADAGQVLASYCAGLDEVSATAGELFTAWFAEAGLVASREPVR